MQRITRDQVQSMMRDQPNLTVIEVLPEKAYQQFHLPGAINVPLADDFDQRIQDALPEKTDPVVVYCQDTACDASPKAARRMDELGYAHVFDYEAGKTDWKEAGLPTE